MHGALGAVDDEVVDQLAVAAERLGADPGRSGDAPLDSRKRDRECSMADTFAKTAAGGKTARSPRTVRLPPSLKP